MTFPHVSRLASEIPGNGGDAMLNAWTMRWAAHAAPTGWDGLWNANMFWPAASTLSYSESLLPIAPLLWILAGITGSVALGINLILLGAWTLSMWATYRLVLRLVGSPGPSIIAAIAFTFSTPRLSTYDHFQLVMGALIPVCILALVWFFENPSLRRGAVFGLTLSILTLSASYYGIMVGIGVAVIVSGHLLLNRPKPMRRFLAGLAVGGAIFLVLVGPVAIRYLRLQENDHFRREPVPVFFAHPGDLLATSYGNRYLADTPPFEDNFLGRTSENTLFPGVIALGLGAVGFVVVSLRRFSDKILDAPSRRTVILIAAAGITLFLLAFGDYVAVGSTHVPMPYKYARQVVPGMRGMRVPARFISFAELSLVVLSAVGLSALLKNRSRLVTIAVVSILGMLILVETSSEQPTVALTFDEDRVAVNRELAIRPDGVVLELPIRSETDGANWAYTESPRLYASTIDWNPRINGYSGFQPPDFEEIHTTLNRFPEPVALEAIDRFDVRYVVLRTSAAMDIGEGLLATIEIPGVGILTDAQALEIIDAIPDDRIADVDHLGEAYLVEFRDSK